MFFDIVIYISYSTISLSFQFTSSCKCVDPPKRADCEDTAVLTNGSIVKIGCKQFNFTYTTDPL